MMCSEDVMSTERFFYFSRNCESLASSYLVSGIVAAADEAEARKKLDRQLAAVKSIDTSDCFAWMQVDTCPRNELGLLAITTVSER
jgi:hypothetical protein